MKKYIHLLIPGLLITLWTIRTVPVQAGSLSLPPLQEESTPTLMLSTPFPSEIINAVNNLRLAHGLYPLTVHPVLMEVAANQANALAATEGMIGHERPCGMTLGQDLLTRGFPLWGDLSMDGYRSENWVAAGTSEQAISFWLSDDEHENTMLSPNRSDIGAAVAVSDQIYVVLETALRTSSGQMQHTAYDILTSIPVTHAACMGASTLNADGSISQYSIPVTINTARPDGDVIHEVKYGQTLWSIAIQYKISIEQIKRLNNLTQDTIVPGWKLLVQKGATQPAPPTSTFVLAPSDQTPSPFPTPTLTTTPIRSPSSNDTAMSAEAFGQQNKIVVVALIISFSVLVAGVVGFRKKKEE